MQYTLLLLTSLAALGSSAVIQKRSTSPWGAPIRAYFEAVGQELKAIKAAKNETPVCDFSSAQLPVADNSPLPSPSEGLSLYHVAVGRGTQVWPRLESIPINCSILIFSLKNYTCSSPTDTPTPCGAVAGLYNASCVAGKFPNILNLIVPAALAVPVPSKPTLFPANLALSGHHFFPDLTTPTFDLRTDRSNYGIYYAKRVANTTAPAGSQAGPDGAAAVPWLKLAVIEPPPDTNPADTVGNVKEIYRVNTAGGSPPKSCEGQPASFEVEYSAEYWFYAPTQQ